MSLVPARAKSNVQFRDIAKGCALSLSGHAYCWNALENVGIIDGSHVEPGDCKAIYYSLYAGHDCWAPTPLASPTQLAMVDGCVLDVAAAIYCAGASGETGELGDGRYGAGVYAVVPVKVLGNQKYRAVSGMCALSLDGVAYCWGSNAFGRLGIGDGLFKAQPTPVLTDQRFVEISSNLNTCALTATDQVWCWGPNAFGINGPTATGDRAIVPVRVELPPL